MNKHYIRWLLLVKNVILQKVRLCIIWSDTNTQCNNISNSTINCNIACPKGFRSPKNIRPTPTTSVMYRKNHWTFTIFFNYVHAKRYCWPTTMHPLHFNTFFDCNDDFCCFIFYTFSTFLYIFSIVLYKRHMQAQLR